MINFREIESLAFLPQSKYLVFIIFVSYPIKAIQGQAPKFKISEVNQSCFH